MQKQKVKLTITVKMADYELLNEEKEWYLKDVFVNNGTLILHSNEIGDAVGDVIKVEDIKFIDE